MRQTLCGRSEDASKAKATQSAVQQPSEQPQALTTVKFSSSKAVSVSELFIAEAGVIGSGGIFAVMALLAAEQVPNKLRSWKWRSRAQENAEMSVAASEPSASRVGRVSLSMPASIKGMVI